MSFVKFEKGEQIKEFIGRPEGPLFDFDSSGATLTVFFNRPTDYEISQFKSDNPFEIRFVEIRGILMILLKIGGLQWMDSPYTVHLSRGALDFSDELEDGLGYSLMLMLVDGTTGTIQHLRMIGLGTNFSRALRKKILNQLNMPFNKQGYETALQSIYSTYRTKDLLKLSKEYYRSY